MKLRDKKGRLSVEERKMKSKSLGDINPKLKTLHEVSILDPSLPVTRVVSTADIPSAVQSENSVLLPKAPRVSNMVSNTKFSSDSLVEAVEPVEVCINVSPPAKENVAPSVNNESTEKSVNPQSTTKESTSVESSSLDKERERSQRPVLMTSPPHPIRLSMSEMDLSSSSSSSLSRKSSGFLNQGIVCSL